MMKIKLGHTVHTFHFSDSQCLQLEVYFLCRPLEKLFKYQYTDFLSNFMLMLHDQFTYKSGL